MKRKQDSPKKFSDSKNAPHDDHEESDDSISRSSTNNANNKGNSKKVTKPFVGSVTRPLSRRDHTNSGTAKRRINETSADSP